MIKYTTLIVFAIYYIIYGICGLAGIQQVPKKHKNKSYTQQYKRSNGLIYLIMGISWLLILKIAVSNDLPRIRIAHLILTVSIAPIVFTFYIDRLFGKKLQNEYTGGENN